QLRVELGMDDLLDVSVLLLAGPHLQLVLQLLDLRALAADDDAGAGGRDGDARAVGRALDVDLGDARVIELVLDEAPDLHVLVQERGVALRREPAGAPAPRHADPETDRMRFLTHRLFLPLRLPARSRPRLSTAPLGPRPRPRPRRPGPPAVRLVAHADREMARPVLDRKGSPHRPRLDPLQHRPTV